LHKDIKEDPEIPMFSHVMNSHLFTMMLPEPRIQTVDVFIKQALCNPFNNVSGIARPLYAQPCITMTERYPDHQRSTNSDIYPGLNVNVAFINMGRLTYEDSFVASVSGMKRFKYEKEQDVPMELREAAELRIGSVIEPHFDSPVPHPVENDANRRSIVFAEIPTTYRKKRKKKERKKERKKKNEILAKNANVT
jgi:hypothetical protein